MIIRAKQAAEILGLSPATVRRWSQEGRIPFTFSAAGQRIYNPQELLAFKAEQLNEPLPETEQKIAFYARSSQGIDTHLNNQIQILTQEYGHPTKIYKDKASGLNDNRKGLNNLIKDARNKEITHVAITHKDRLTRFGYKYLEEHLKDLGVTILYTNNTLKSPQEELMSDFMSLIASFSGKFYRLRGWEQQARLLHKATQEVNKHEQK